MLTVPGTDVLFAGDLLENGAVPWYGDGYPIEWVTTAAHLARLVDPERGVVVPGHGDHAGRAFADEQAASIAALGFQALHNMVVSVPAQTPVYAAGFVGGLR